MRLVAIGEVMAEIRQIQPTASDSHDGFSVGFAGDTFNTAIYCARLLGVENEVGYVTRIGYDPLSTGLISMLTSEGLATDYIAKDQNHNIGIYSVTTDNLGERSFHYWRNQSAARQLFTTEETALFLPDADVIYLSGITLAIMQPIARIRLFEALADKRKSGIKIAYDSNYRPALWEDKQTAQETMRTMWGLTDIALPSIDDEMALFDDKSEEDVIARFAQLGCERVAVKRGVRGPVAPALADEAYPVFAPAAKVVDTTAAGDSFNGGYLAAYLLGLDEATCLLQGHDLAAKVVGAPGAIMAKTSDARS